MQKKQRIPKNIKEQRTKKAAALLTADKFLGQSTAGGKISRTISG